MINQETTDLSEPAVTVITVVFNAESTLEGTILSIIGQSYTNIKFLLVDGGSTDASLEIIRKYQANIDYWISEKDKGIYDAMNKASKLAGPGYLCFMNAGDVFYSSESVARAIARVGSAKPGVIYGDSQVEYANGYTRVLPALEMDQLRWGMCFSHQSMMIDCGLMQQRLYNIDNPIGADYELVCHLYSNRIEFLRVDEVIASTTSGGVSDEKRLASIRSHWLVSRKYWPGLKTDAYYILASVDAMLRQLIRRLLPQGLVDKLIRFKYS